MYLHLNVESSQDVIKQTLKEIKSSAYTTTNK